MKKSRFKKVSFFVVLTIFSIVQSQTLPENMSVIPAGKFIMGKNSETGADFSPAHEVKVDSFLLDCYEVTNAGYFKFCKETGYKLPETWGNNIFRCGPDYPDYPVTGINWYDANKYAAWAGKRLPTEAEWEYAARGGLLEKEFPNGNDWNIEQQKNISGTAWQNLIVEVSSYDSNGFGLFNMSGNVWEWVADRYDYDYYKNSPSINPVGSDKGYIMVIRGGSWHSGNMCKKVYFRRGLPSNWVDFAVGFRCAKDL